MAMKTTLNIDDRLMREAKKLAAERGTTLTQVVEEALRAAVHPPARRVEFRLDLPTVKGDRPPDVDIADRTALTDLMDGES